MIGDQYTSKIRRLQQIMGHELGVTSKWYEIGLELMDNKIVELEEIKCNHPNNIRQCCMEMFKMWLKYDPDADWDKLATAFSTVRLENAAESIKSKLMSRI